MIKFRHRHDPGRTAHADSARWLRRSGVVLLIAGCAANPWLLGRLLSPDGVIDDTVDLVIIYAFAAALITWGLANLLFCRRPLIAKLNLSAGALVIVSPLIAECALRTGIALRWTAVCQPGLYFDAYCDDEYWKLMYLWDALEKPHIRTTVEMEHDPLVGWRPSTTADNPVGIVMEEPVDMQPGESAVLCYGDSFMEGTTARLADRIPQQLDNLLEQPVLNLGVSGYGVDQIYLRLRETHRHWKHPLVLFGLLTSDLDRCVLRFRMAPKPFYTITDRALQLHGPPLPRDPRRWLEEHPPRVPSYLLALMDMRWRLHAPGPLREYPRRQQEKCDLNRLLLRQVVQFTKQERLPLLFIVFYDPEELGYVGWRETFLQRELADLGVPYIDTKPVLLEAARQQNCSWWEFHQSDHHLNDAGNRLVASAVAAKIEQLTTQ